MDPATFLRTIYLGDRACKGIAIDGWNKQVALHVDVISRIRSTTGTWDYYTDEDIKDGRLVFTGVSMMRFEPAGPIPNDLISEIHVTDVNDLRSGRREFAFQISVASVDETGSSTEVTVELQAENLHIEDPARPGELIRR
jgi:hypothetical protein